MSRKAKIEAELKTLAQLEKRKDELLTKLEAEAKNERKRKGD